MRKLYVALLVMLFATPSKANYDDKLQELMNIMNLDGQEKFMDEQLITPVICSFDMPSAEENNVRNRILRILDFKNKTISMVTPIWKENFTEEEIDEILAFYKTEVGQKTIALMPKITQRIAMETMKYQQEIAPQLQEIASDLISKYSQRTETEVKLCMQRRTR